MNGDFFLGRTEEQELFRQKLRILLPTWFQRSLPTLFKIFNQPPQSENPLPYVFLLYGEAGMGKTSLVRQFRNILTIDKSFRGQFELFSVDWEDEKKLNQELQIGHDNIHPEAMMAVLHKTLCRKGNNDFGKYHKQVENLKKAEARVEDELQKIPPDAQFIGEVTKWGAQGIAWMIRSASGGEIIPTEKLESFLETGIKISAESLYQAQRLLQRLLTSQEYEVYAQPHDRLAEALGQGISKLAERKPLVILLDTYEIVDRPVCDYTLRKIIRCSGDQVIWVIAGRSNLADSGQRGSLYFQGYKRDFPEDRIYAKSLGEFGLQEIQSYFQKRVPTKLLTEQQAEELAKFSLGIPFVVSLAAEMYQTGKPLEEITAPFQGRGREQVVKATCDRFLMHCFSAKEREKDLEAVYALTMMRRPNAELLKEVLNVPDLEPRLQELRQRYSFIGVEELQINEKLSAFLREYLLQDVYRTKQIVQSLNGRALIWLQLQLEQLTHDITDTAEWFQENRITEIMLDLAHHYFWESEEAGWHYSIPRFIEGWQYNQNWMLGLLEVIGSFQSMLSQDGLIRLEFIGNGVDVSCNPDVRKQLLKEIEKCSQRRYVDIQGMKEQSAILLMRQGQLLYSQGRYKEALEVYLETERQLPDQAIKLKKDLAEEFYTLSREFIWRKNPNNAAYSADGEQAIAKAVALDPERANFFYYLGVVRAEAYRYEEAITAYRTAIELDPSFTYPYNGLGNVYYNQGRYEEAISTYQYAIQLDPKYISPHIGLGNIYCDQGSYNAAITAFQTIISFDPDNVPACVNLGWIYLLQNDLIEAQSQLQRAVSLDPEDYHSVFNLGLVYSLQGNNTEALSQWQRSRVLCTGDSIQDRLLRALYTVAVGDPEQGMSQLQRLLDDNEPIEWVLSNVLEDAELLAQCQVQPLAINQIIEILKKGIHNQGSSRI